MEPTFEIVLKNLRDALWETLCELIDICNPHCYYIKRQNKCPLIYSHIKAKLHIYSHWKVVLHLKDQFCIHALKCKYVTLENEQLKIKRSRMGPKLLNHSENRKVKCWYRKSW